MKLLGLVDGGPFPVFSAVRLSTALPGPHELNAMTTDAVSQLLTAMDTADTVGWTTANITAGLLLAATEVRSWEGEEWALESGPDDEALAWAQPEDSRTPFKWLRARGVTHNMLLDTQIRTTEHSG